jgi:hypothetical protein
MQLMRENVDKIAREAPHLLDSIVSGEAEFIMKRDATTDMCVKFDAGWCGIQREYGSDILGDACHFFPRITRALGDVVFTTAALSCPEIARLTLTTPNAFATSACDAVRTPHQMRNYLPDAFNAEDALAIHQQFLDGAAAENYTAEQNILRIGLVARALELQPKKNWKGAAGFYFSTAGDQIPSAEHQPTDPFNLMHALHGLVAASPSKSKRLHGLLARMADMLMVTFAGANHQIQLADGAPQRSVALIQHSQRQSPHLQPFLRRYLQAQMSQALFPFAGFGNTLAERVTIIGVRLATLKLALMTLAEQPTAEAVVETVQILSRFMDHLGAPELSLRIYHETGWDRLPRLRAALGA